MLNEDILYFPFEVSDELFSLLLRIFRNASTNFMWDTKIAIKSAHLH